jgi:hypothetical protein
VKRASVSGLLEALLNNRGKFAECRSSGGAVSAVTCEARCPRKMAISSWRPLAALEHNREAPWHGAADGC